MPTTSTTNLCLPASCGRIVVSYLYIPSPETVTSDLHGALQRRRSFPIARALQWRPYSPISRGSCSGGCVLGFLELLCSGNRVLGFFELFCSASGVLRFLLLFCSYGLCPWPRKAVALKSLGSCQSSPCCSWASIWR